MTSTQAQRIQKYVFGGFVLAFLLGIGFSPELDLWISQQFFVAGVGFPARTQTIPLWLHEFATTGARWLLLLLVLGVLVAWWRRAALGLAPRAWIFLLLALLIGPGLVANLILKDQWGRARPVQITEFGGQAQHTPALLPTNQCVRNCSFVSGDGSFGFAFHALGYVMPRQRRWWFWGGLGMGVLLGGNRILMGGHFFSDVVFAAFFMLITLAALYALLFGRAALRSRWQEFLGKPS